MDVRRTGASLLLLGLAACNNSGQQQLTDAPPPAPVLAATQPASGVVVDPPSSQPTPAASPSTALASRDPASIRLTAAADHVCWSAYAFPSVHVPALHVPALHVPALHVPPLHVAALHVPALHIAPTTINGHTYPARDYPEHDYPSRDYPERDYPAQDYPARDYAGHDYPARQIGQDCKQVAAGFSPRLTTVLPAKQLSNVDPSYSPVLTQPLLDGLGSEAVVPDFTASGFGELNQAGFPKNQFVPTYIRHDGTAVNGYWRNAPTDGLPTCGIIRC